MWIIIILVGMLAVYLLVIMPALGNKKDFTPFENRYFAHRGLFDMRRKIPENSYTAFKKAVKSGFGIEMDVQLTKDQIPVIIHDYDLLRVCGRKNKILDLTYDELKKCRLLNTKESIPLFQEVLDLVKGQIPLIIEIKEPFLSMAVCRKVMAVLENYDGKYCIESFNPLVLLWLRRHYPDVIRGQLSTDFHKEGQPGNKLLMFLMKNMMFNFLTRPDFISYNHLYQKSWSFRICRKMYKVKTFAWTIRSKQDIQKSKKRFHYYIFDSFMPEEAHRGDSCESI